MCALCPPLPHPEGYASSCCDVDSDADIRDAHLINKATDSDPFPALSPSVDDCLRLGFRPSPIPSLLRSIPAAMAEKKITLKSSDGEVFEVEETVAMESQTIKHMIEDDCAGNGIPLPNVTSKILSKVIEYCKKHVDAAAASSKSADDTSSKPADDELKTWDADFVKVDQATLFDLILVRSLAPGPISSPLIVDLVWILCLFHFSINWALGLEMD